MEKINLEAGDILIIDPGYIKHVEDERYDALRLTNIIYEGDDGFIELDVYGDKTAVGVDSGRIWAMRAEFDCEVTVDAGASGYYMLEDSVNADGVSLI